MHYGLHRPFAQLQCLSLQYFYLQTIEPFELVDPHISGNRTDHLTVEVLSLFSVSMPHCASPKVKFVTRSFQMGRINPLFSKVILKILLASRELQLPWHWRQACTLSFVLWLKCLFQLRDRHQSTSPVEMCRSFCLKVFLCLATKISLLKSSHCDPICLVSNV